ncbi:MAG: hypothetical protein A2041_14785 [Bacteroidetes bacterium GWA2_31_9b]|nr:MAG: hypothetical protein A2041_14785 [Bacteroidetes bacterium GWA2_31_9b]
MKIKTLIILAILFVFSCQNTPKENTKQVETIINQNDLANAQKVEINIEGMTCTGCENAIQKTIDNFDGVYSSKADFKKGIAVFEFDSTKVDIIKVKDAINELGYKVKNHSILNE